MLSHQMALITKMIKYGYSIALRYADKDDESFLEQRSQMTERELIQEYNNLKARLQSSSL